MKNKATIHIISREFFQVSLVTYLVLTLAETLKTGSVSNFFNLNYLLIVVVATGVMMVLTEPTEVVKKLAKEVLPVEVQQIIKRTRRSLDGITRSPKP